MTSQNGPPGELPPGWARSTLGQITFPSRPKLHADPGSNLPFIGMDSIEPNGFTPINVGRFGDMKSAASAFHDGDVLYGRLRPYLNKVWCAEYSGAASAEFIVFPSNEFVSSRFLKFLLHDQRFVNFASSAISGDRPRVDLSDIARYQVAVPPLAEQSRIAARIEELFGEIEAGEQELEKAREALETYRRAVLKAAVTGELTKQWREKSAPTETGAELLSSIRSHNAKAERTSAAPAPDTLPELPREWVWCSVAEAGEASLGRQRAPQHHQGEDMRPYLRVANVLEGKLDLTDVKQMNFTPREFEVFRLVPGDILLNEGQAPDLVGRPAIYRGEIAECCFQKTLLRFRARPGVVPEYALLVFRHYMHSGRFRREARITTNIGHLTLVRFAPMEFPLPPTGEQSEITRCAQWLEETIDHKELLTLTGQAAALRQSILSAAFAGKLVSQDDNEEPAEVQLDRLRTAKEVMAARAAMNQPALVRRAARRKMPVRETLP